MLPLFAYGAVGFANGRFYVCAKKVDEDVRQVFKGISRGKIDRSARKIIEDFPDNSSCSTSCRIVRCVTAARRRRT